MLPTREEGLRRRWPEVEGAVLHHTQHLLLNPLVPEGKDIYRIAKNSFLKMEGIKEKNSYERRVY